MDSSKISSEAVIVNPPNNGGAAFQQSMPVLQNAGPGRQKNYPKMKVIPIKIFSAACIILGITSIGIQIAALVLNTTRIYNNIYFPEADYVGSGIWGGSFYVIAGSLGIAATFKRTKSLLVGTLVMSALSIAASITAATLSGIAAGQGAYCYSYQNCSYVYEWINAWYGLEWSLMGVSILAFCMVIPLLVLASVNVCCSKPSGNSTNMAAHGFHQPYAFTGNGQPVYYYQPQQLGQHPPFQVAYVNQQAQQQPPLPQMIPVKQEESSTPTV